MCGRYKLARRKQILAEHFLADWDELEWHPRYNIAPTQPVPIVRQNPKTPNRQISLASWGLIPSWSKDSSNAAKMINARSETAATLPAFRDAMKSRRCLVPADGFYEWAKRGKMKQPYCFEVEDGNLFAFAGTWDDWKKPTGGVIETCSILTTTANALTSSIHDRMPVIIHSSDYELWLDPGTEDVTVISDFLKPYDHQLMRCYPVSDRINRVANDDDQCSAPVELVKAQSDLFSS
jgi:putative SOS response-associated peptidase YedK